MTTSQRLKHSLARPLPAAFVVSAALSALLTVLVLEDDAEREVTSREPAPQVTEPRPQRPAPIQLVGEEPPRRAAPSPRIAPTKPARPARPAPTTARSSTPAPTVRSAPQTSALPTRREAPAAKGPSARVLRRAKQERRIARLTRRYGLQADGFASEGLEDLIGGGEDLFDKWQATGARDVAPR